MKAFIKTRYGGPEILRLEEVGMPVLKDEYILVKVLANSANPADWHILRGQPFIARFSFGLFKPKNKILGADFAGIVVKTGSNISQFKIGDRVFGEVLKGGAFAEYISVAESDCALMPGNASFSEMASVPIAGLTALQAVTTYGKLKTGEKVLINGSSGGVGHFAVQIAKTFGAKVTAVCSSRNVDFVGSLGADAIIAYDKENIHQHAGKYDLVIDTNGNLFHSDYMRMGGRGVVVGFTSMTHMIGLSLKKAMSKFPLVQFTAWANQEDLQTLARLIQENKVRPFLERTFSHKEIPAAISYIERMRTKGKVVMVWETAVANEVV